MNISFCLGLGLGLKTLTCEPQSTVVFLLSLNQLLILLLIFPPGPAPSCSVGHTSQWSIRSHCSAPSSVALAKCQCWDLGLLILLLNVAALSGEKGPDWSVNKALLWRMSELFEPSYVKTCPTGHPPDHGGHYEAKEWHWITFLGLPVCMKCFCGILCIV